MKQSIQINSQDIVEHLIFSRKIDKIIEQISHYKLVKLVAAEAKVKISSEEFQQAADNFRIAQRIYTSADTKSWLYRHHLSLDDFKFIVYTNALAHKLARHLFIDRVEPWFEKHQLDYSSAIIYEIILPSKDLAEKLSSKLNGSQVCFCKVARQYLQSQFHQQTKGHFGLVSSKMLNSKIASLVFSASPPEILQPITTKQGTHLILVEKIIQPQLNEQLRNQILSELFTDWLERKIQEIGICVQVNHRALLI